VAGGGIQIKAEVKGLNQLVRSMNKAGIDLTELKDANKAAGEIVARRGQTNAPTRTGALRRSVKAARQARRAQVKAGGGRVRYARYVEFGGRGRAQPFLYPAAAQTKPQWLKAYEADLTKIINSIHGV
jgi:HK97 gp10 family phage protein